MNEYNLRVKQIEEKVNFQMYNLALYDNENET